MKIDPQGIIEWNGAVDSNLASSYNVTVTLSSGQLTYSKTFTLNVEPPFAAAGSNSAWSLATNEQSSVWITQPQELWGSYSGVGEAVVEVNASDSPLTFHFTVQAVGASSYAIAANPVRVSRGAAS